MPSISLDDRLIWFAHCPKAGGTSVEKFMVARWGKAVGHLDWGWDKWWKSGGWRKPGPPCSPQHLIWNDAKEKLAKEPDYVFAVVRDPAERLASEYRFQRKYRRGTLLGKAVARLPFSLWLRLMLSASRLHPYLLDNHLRLQSDFVPEHATVFQLENGLEPVLVWLSQNTGIEDVSEPEHFLATGKNTRVTDSDLARIQEAFEEDYRIFGYSKPKVPPKVKDRWDVVAELVAPLFVALDKRGKI